MENLINKTKSSLLVFFAIIVIVTFGARDLQARDVADNLPTLGACRRIRSGFERLVFRLDGVRLHRRYTPISPASPSLPVEKTLALGPTTRFSDTLLAKVLHSSDFGWTANQDISGQFETLLNSGKLKAGQTLVLDHMFRFSGSHELPNNFTLSAVKEGGFDVTDAVTPENNRPLLELGNNNTLRNLTITYLNTPEPGPTGEQRGVTFTSRLGIQARDKHDLLPFVIQHSKVDQHFRRNKS